MGAGSTGFDEYVNEVSGERDSELSFGRRTTGQLFDAGTVPMPTARGSMAETAVAPSLHEDGLWSSGGARSGAGSVGVCGAAQSNRWRKRSAGQSERPSKSPRRDHPVDAEPWPVCATGRTPEGRSRVVQSLREAEENELVPEEEFDTRSWILAWLQILRFAAENGTDLVGELVVCAEQEAILPLVCDEQAEQATVHAAAVCWQGLMDTLRAPTEPQPGRLHAFL